MNNSEKMTSINNEYASFDLKMFHAENRLLAIMPNGSNTELLDWLYNHNNKSILSTFA